MVVVKDLVNSQNHTYPFFEHCKPFCLGLFFGYYCFFVLFFGVSVIIDICMERTWIRESLFNIEKGV